MMNNDDTTFDKERNNLEIERFLKELEDPTTGNNIAKEAYREEMQRRKEILK